MPNTENSENSENKRRRGPKPDPVKKRDIRVNVYLSTHEHQKLLEKVGCKPELSAYFRDTALSSRRRARIVVPELNAEAYAALARAAANLNQIARKLNTEGVSNADAIREALHDFRLSLIGAKGNRR